MCRCFTKKKCFDFNGNVINWQTRRSIDYRINTITFHLIYSCKLDAVHLFLRLQLTVLLNVLVSDGTGNNMRFVIQGTCEDQRLTPRNCPVWSRPSLSLCYYRVPASVVQLDAPTTGDQEVAGSHPPPPAPPPPATFFHRNWSCNILRLFSPFRWLKMGSCQFLVKECAEHWLTAQSAKPAQ